jgi:hypothetical protein
VSPNASQIVAVLMTDLVGRPAMRRVRKNALNARAVLHDAVW